MKVLLTAFALLSFVAASALPITASAEDMNNGQSTTSKSDTGSKMDSGMSSDKGTMDKDKSATTHKTTHKTATHKTTHKKTTKKKTHHKHTAKRKTAPKTTTTAPKQG